MRESLIISVLLLVGATVPLLAAAQDCDYHNIKLDLSTWEAVPPPIDPYENCFQLKARGTLTGRYVTCWNDSEARGSDAIWGDGQSQFIAYTITSRFETDRGDIHMTERSWLDAEWGNESGVVRILGGTGVYDGASGTFSFAPTFPNYWARNYTLEGLICTP